MKRSLVVPRGLKILSNPLRICCFVARWKNLPAEVIDLHGEDGYGKSGFNAAWIGVSEIKIGLLCSRVLTKPSWKREGQTIDRFFSDFTPRRNLLKANSVLTRDSFSILKCYKRLRKRGREGISTLGKKLKNVELS